MPLSESRFPINPRTGALLLFFFIFCCLNCAAKCTWGVVRGKNTGISVFVKGSFSPALEFVYNVPGLNSFTSHVNVISLAGLWFLARTGVCVEGSETWPICCMVGTCTLSLPSISYYSPTSSLFRTLIWAAECTTLPNSWTKTPPLTVKSWKILPQSKTVSVNMAVKYIAVFGRARPKWLFFAESIFRGFNLSRGRPNRCGWWYANEMRYLSMQRKAPGRRHGTVQSKCANIRHLTLAWLDTAF